MKNTTSVQDATSRGSFAGRLGFVLAAAGSAVGLGNLWKFPYLTYRHGGGSEGSGAGAFVLIYLAAVLLIGAPVMLAEIFLGKKTGLNPVGAFRSLRPKGGWKFVGGLGVATGFVLLSYYSIVAGWTVQYVIYAVTGALSGDADTSGSLFTGFLASPSRQIGFHAAFMGMTIAVIVGGVSKGIERWTKMLMPVLLGILAVLTVRSLTLPGGSRALTFLFYPDFSAINRGLVLEAVGQAFFSLSLGMGAIITYGSYMKREERIGPAAVSVVLLDTLVALMASIIVFGSIFSFNLSMDSGGIGNLFTTIPVIFSKIPAGALLLIMFYLLIMFAALTSTVSLLETVSAYFIDELGMNRKKAAALSGGAIFALGIPSALSFNLMADATLGGRTFFDWMDYFCANISLPLGGLGVALFVGWALTQREVEGELGSEVLTKAWRFSLRYLAPVAILAVTLGMLFGGVDA